MLFKLANEERKFIGITQVEKSWELIKFNNEIYLYFDKDRLVKKITVTLDFYYEVDLNEITIENRSIVLPKTEKGKNKRLNFTALESINPIGVYFLFDGYVKIGNFTTQQTFYSSFGNEEKTVGLDGLKRWIDQWIKDFSEQDFADINAFKTAKRKHCKYSEGDFFIFKVGRRKYGFGRILLDVNNIKKDIKSGKVKEKHYGLTQLMGKPLIIKVYNFVSDSKDVDLNHLKNSNAFLSQNIMDNVFYYGEYEIIGNQPLEPQELEFPISYSRSINATDKDIVYLQYGLIYKETDISKYNKYLYDSSKAGYESQNPFRNECIGFGFPDILKQLQGTTDTATPTPNRDLRNVENRAIKNDIFSFFCLDADKNYAENYKIYSRTK